MRIRILQFVFERMDKNMARSKYPKIIFNSVAKIVSDNLRDLVAVTGMDARTFSQTLRKDLGEGEIPDDSKENRFSDTFISDIIEKRTIPSIEAVYVITHSLDLPMNVLLIEKKGKSKEFSELLDLAINHPLKYKRMLEYSEKIKNEE